MHYVQIKYRLTNLNDYLCFRVKSDDILGNMSSEDMVQPKTRVFVVSFLVFSE